MVEDKPSLSYLLMIFKVLSRPWNMTGQPLRAHFQKLACGVGGFEHGAGP